MMRHHCFWGKPGRGYLTQSMLKNGGQARRTNRIGAAPSLPRCTMVLDRNDSSIGGDRLCPATPFRQLFARSGRACHISTQESSEEQTQPDQPSFQIRTRSVVAAGARVPITVGGHGIIQIALGHCADLPYKRRDDGGCDIKPIE